MSGHNRWTKIKRKKEAMGASKGALFTKLIREVTVAARNGGGDPDHNARLRSAVLAAREANMPNDTIARAVKKGTGELEGVAYEEGGFEVRTEPAALMQVHKALEGKLPVGAPKMVFLPKTTVQVSGGDAEKVLRLVENLEDNDDVQHVYANFEMDEGTIAQLESRA